MNWLFRKKKVPKVPLPVGKLLDDKTLRFPAPSKEKAEAEEIKEAVGFNAPLAFPEKEFSEDDSMEAETTVSPLKPYEFKPLKEDLFIKVDVYQRVLGEIDSLKKDLTKLNETSKGIEESEYNEDKNFNKLRKIMKNLHDHLLKVDKTLFNF